MKKYVVPNLLPNENAWIFLPLPLVKTMSVILLFLFHREGYASILLIRFSVCHNGAFAPSFVFPLDPAIPLLGIYNKQIITHSTIFSLLLNCPRGMW